MAEPVHIRRIALRDYRNYTDVSLDLDVRHVVLTGPNGAGKTNLMEAVSLLSPGRGLRRAAYGDLVRSGADGGFTVFAKVCGMAGEADIGTAAGDPAEQGSRKVRIDGHAVRSSEALLDHLRVTWLTPSMDGLFTGSAGDRRRFLDRMVMSVDPLHGRRAIDYEHAMRSRNRLLAENRLDPAWLDGLELQMAELGVAMALARRDILEALSSVIARGSEAVAAFPQAAIALQGFADEAAPPASRAATLAAVDLETALADDLKSGRRRDQAAGRTLNGPHRQDMTIRHKAKDMPAAQSSTGEQKALLIGLVLAHARLIASMTGHAPLLLLDEVAAHLDPDRRAALFDLIDTLGAQAFMTGTDPAMFDALGTRAMHLKVEAGSLAPCA